jgi:hypothetical protein
VKEHPGLGELQRHGWDISAWHLVIDEKGAPLGKFKIVDHQPLREDIEVIRKFLIKFKRKDEAMPEKKDQEQTNICYVAGYLKFDPKSYESNVSCLVDVGLKTAIQLSVYVGENSPDGNSDIASKLKRFKEGDFIKTICMLRPYGVKNGDKWKNSLSIDITAIKNDPPERAKSRQQHDDDIPY